MATAVRRVGENASLCGHQASFVDVGGIRTRYYDVGRGEPMVLCHGAGWMGYSSANVWTLNLAGLGQTFRVLAADKLASGMTDNPASDEDFAIQAQVAHMYGFIRAMGVERCHLVGQSRGGYLAARLALEHPEMVLTLVLVDSATLAPEVGDYAQRRRETLANPPADLRERIRWHWSSMSFNTEHVTDDYVEAGYFMETQPKALETKRRWENGGEERFNRSLREQKQETLRWLREGRLQAPTLVYWARNDPTAILDQGLALFNLIAETNRRVRMLIVHQAGHFHFREYPEEFNRNVTSFATGW